MNEKECRKNFDRNDFVEELNKFLNINFNDYNSKDAAAADDRQRTNQRYVAVNDNSESIIDPRTGNRPKKTGYQTSSTNQNYPNIFNLEKDFFNNLFDDLFSHHLPKQASRTDYNTNSNTNYNTNYPTNGNINVNGDGSLEKQIEREADIIIQQISNGLK